MKVWLKEKRKDGRFKIVYAFANGVKITKIVSEEKMKEEIAKSENKGI